VVAEKVAVVASDASYSIDRQRILGILADFPIARAFGFDAFGAVLFSGPLAARHHHATVGICAGHVGRFADGRGGPAQSETAADYPDRWCRSARMGWSR
jgi:hypothetical protein